MTIYWGVVSSHAANSTVAAVGNPTLFDFITKQVQFPQFYGRFIGGRYSLTADEINFIFGQGDGSCSILLIYNGATPGEGYYGGVMDANNAISAAQALEVPTGITLYADIESGVRVSPDWILGWMDTMNASMYANPGGFYCNPSAWNEKNFNHPYCIAITGPSNLRDDGTFISNPPLFSSAPRMDCSFITDDPALYTPLAPPCAPSSAVIWQYALGCFKSSTYPRGLCDMDLANDDGYATMWSGLPLLF